MIEDQDFENYQRILSGYPAVSFTLLGFHLTVTIAGLAGVFALVQSGMPVQQVTFWISSLGFLAAFVTLLLALMWCREHTLKDKVVAELKANQLRFPSTPAWTGVVTAMHILFYSFGILFWLALALVSTVCPKWLLEQFGL